MIGVKYDDKAWQQYLKRAKAACADMSPAMAEIREKLESRVRTVFATNVDPWGNQWADWADEVALLNARQRRGQNNVGMLIDTGKLYSSLKGEHGPKHMTLTIGDDESGEYADVHQFGNETTPARPYFPLETPDQVTLPGEWYDACVLPLNKLLLGAFQ